MGILISYTDLRVRKDRFMRVIAGTARSIPLKTPDGMDTRPTQDRIKETLFNILMPDIPGCRFLDIFSGSGAIGIEAASRGAAEVVLIEKQRKAAAVIRSNLKAAGVEDLCTLYTDDCYRLIPTFNKRCEPFDIIFMDPPYDHDYELKVLELLKDNACADPYTTIIVEASLKTDLSCTEAMGYEITRIKKYKTNQHIFLRKSK